MCNRTSSRGAASQRRQKADCLYDQWRLHHGTPGKSCPWVTKSSSSNLGSTCYESTSRSHSVDCRGYDSARFQFGERGQVVTWGAWVLLRSLVLGWLCTTNQALSVPAVGAPAASSGATAYQVNKIPVPAEQPLPAHPSTINNAPTNVPGATSSGWSVLPRSSWDYGRFPPYH